MEGSVVMNSREQRCYNLAVSVIEGRLSIVEFSLLVGKSYRQSQRIIRRVRERQMFGIKHGNLHKTPSNKIPGELKKIVQDLLRGKYYDFNLLHFQERLREEEGLDIKRETLRKWAHEINLVKRFKIKRRSTRVHKPRPRMPRRGMLIQFDGSEHDWFSGRGPYCTLIGGIDDATGAILDLEFFEVEDLLSCLRVMYNIVSQHGVPEAFYLDQASFFGKSYREQDSTQIGRALSEIGSKVILANSPQAKGRIERLWGTLQDRLVAELRLKEISGAQAANAFLKEVFIPDFNKRFSIKARDSESAFKPHEGISWLKERMCTKDPRKIATGNTFSWNSEWYVIEDKVNYRFRKVIAKTYPDGTKGFEVFGKEVTTTCLGQTRAYAKRFKPDAA